MSSSAALISARARAVLVGDEFGQPAHDRDRDLA